MAPFFGGRKGNRLPQAPSGWPQVPSVQPAQEHRVLHPPTPVLEGSALAHPDPMPDEELLERIDTFRGIVADSLYEVSKDYRMLCNLTHADLKACDEIIDELRKRLAGNTHYAVLAKLDEAHALAEANLGKG